MATSDQSSLKILGIAGSLRKDSYNKAALRVAQAVAPEGVSIEQFDIDGIPGFNQDNEKNPPEKIIRLKELIRSSDAILIATPEYNYSIPGVLKNAIDWASRPYGDNAWIGKPVAIMGASAGMLGTARAQYHLRQILVAFNMPAVNQPEVMIANAATRFDSAGNLTDEQTKELIRKLVNKLVAWTRTLQKNT
jgi:chromate reductase, NAD(P)H dehydrogenase (quinone)